MDIYRCMRKSDQWVKSNYSNTCHTSNNDSACSDHNSMRSNTNIFNSYIYKWTYRIMSDHRNISNIYILCCTWSMRRNNHRDMDSNGCMRKSTCICIKNHYGKSSSLANDDSTCKHHSSLRCNTCSKYIDI